MPINSSYSHKTNPNQSAVAKRIGLFWLGGAKGSRTPDLLNAIQTRYQLRYNPESSVVRSLYYIFCCYGKRLRAAF